MSFTVLNFLLHYVLHGFILWSFFWIVGKRTGWKVYYSVDVIDRVAVKIVAIMAIAYLLYWLFDFLFAWYNPTSVTQYAFMFGPYWSAYLFMAFTFLLLPQIFWIEKVRALVWVRIIAGLWMLVVLNFEKIIIIITSFHRHYAPSY